MGADEAVEFDYDWDADVLYISFGPPRPARGEHYDDDIVLRYALDTDDLVGITVLGYRRIGGPEGLLHRLSEGSERSKIGCIREHVQELRELVPA